MRTGNSIERHKIELKQPTFNVLITSLSNKVPLVREVKKALKRISKNGKIIGGDTDPKCIGRYFVDEFWQMPVLVDLRIDEFIDFCLGKKISVIFPTRDGELLYFAKYNDELMKIGIHTMISTFKGVETCIDKLRFYENLRNDSTVPIVPTAEDINGIEGSVFVAKERLGAGAKNIALNVSKKDAIKHARRLNAPIFQPFIAGKEYSVDFYITRNGTPKGAISRSRDLIRNGESQVTTTARKPALEKFCATVAKVLKLRGHLVFQAVEDKVGVYHILECNCRFGGASTLSMAAGLDSFYWFMMESMGDDLSNIPFHRKEKTLRQIRFPQDMIIDDYEEGF